MTPTHYTRRQLRQLLGKNTYYFFHWCSFASAVNIVRECHIYSKAMLFGLYFSDLSKLNHIRPQNAKTEAENGFIDYVFLGNTNWIGEGLKSFYGDICFVIKAENILPRREFFVFPFNTGRNFLHANNKQKVSDLSILTEAIESKHLSYEVLIRRRIKINQNSISKILCSEEQHEEILNELKNKKLNIEVENYIKKEHRTDEAIILADPLDPARTEIKYRSGEFIIKDDLLYVRTKFSNCILTAHVNSKNELLDPYTHKIIGKKDTTNNLIPV